MELCKKVNPAFTSLKMYNLSIHKAASYVIGRRGLGFNEKLSLYKYPSSLVKNVFLTLLEIKQSVFTGLQATGKTLQKELLVYHA